MSVARDADLVGHGQSGGAERGSGCTPRGKTPQRATPGFDHQHDALTGRHAEDAHGLPLHLHPTKDHRACSPSRAASVPGV